MIVSIRERGFAVIETVLVLVVVAILGFTGWFVWQAKQNTDKSLSDTSKSQLGIVKASKVTDFASCKAATGSKILETFPEQCMTKDGKAFTDVSQSATSSTPARKGTITGALGYPSSGNPAQKVCAELINDATKVACVTTQTGQNTYTLDVAAGSYYVYASLVSGQGDFSTSYKAYYDEFSKCGNTASCPAAGHAKYMSVSVSAGKTTSGVDPQDWYNTNP